MKFNSALFISGSLVCATALAALIPATPAYAAPVVVKVGADFSETPYAFTVDDSTFTFSGTGDPFGPTAVQTAGGALVNAFGGFLGIPIEPTTYFINRGTVIFGPGALYAPFPTATEIPYSNSYNFIGLEAVDDGQDYYGYAFTTDNVLNGYVFESSPDTAITATAALPEPGSWVMAIGGFGVIGTALRRRNKMAVRYA